MTTKIRAFYAIDLNDEVRNATRHIIENLKTNAWQQHIRWTSIENLHLTLRFLGEVDHDTIDSLNKLLLSKLNSVTTFNLMLKEPRLFPHFKKPRIIAVGVSQNEQLLALAQLLESCAIAVGLAPEARQFKAHLTLGRCDKLFPRRTKLPSMPFSSKLPVKNITLFQSKLTEHGPIYTPLLQLPLAKVPSPVN